MEELDEVDVKILKRLEEDGRMSFNLIANELDVSPPTVKYRIDKLKKRGFIKKFSVIYDLDKFKKGYFIFILAETKFQKLNEIVEELEKIDNIQEIYTSLDKNNLILKLFVEDNEELNHFITTKLSQFKDIEKFQAISILKTIKRDENPSVLRPGFGFKIACDYCHAEIKGTPVKATVDKEDYYFCCNTCKKVFLERFEKSQKK
ncbi:MAG: winged helix-turn-helix transcriptional regulator [Candidatus Helarchaeota archaeon]|nr:winged helix-turn-helix transcriptional regulator [Candidatus Helarchaeota archaeon]